MFAGEQIEEVISSSQVFKERRYIPWSKSLIPESKCLILLWFHFPVKKSLYLMKEILTLVALVPHALRALPASKV